MPATRELKRRIRSIRSSKQITKALELVSAAKMKTAGRIVVTGRPYLIALQDLLSHVLAVDSSLLTHPLLQPGRGKQDLLVVIGSDRGQAGAFTSNLLKAVTVFRKDHPDSLYTPIGKKIETSLRLLDTPLLSEEVASLSSFTPPEIHALSDRLQAGFLNSTFRSVHLLYTHFHSSLLQQTKTIQLLPVVAPALLPVPELQFEPSSTELFENLLPAYVDALIWQAFLESSASEQAARRLAMKNATDNADDMITTLNLTYNQLRQAAITLEIAEITGGTAALAEA